MISDAIMIVGLLATHSKTAFVAISHMSTKEAVITGKAAILRNATGLHYSTLGI